MLFIMSLFVFMLGGIVAFAKLTIKVDSIPLVDRIDAVLPQTQCGKCGYPGCRPYAEAIANKEANINQCPPGGEEGIRDLANLLGVKFLPFAPDVVLKPASVALIDETICIGCTLCLQACPVDAISGASKQMHTIVASLCTGCELCVAPCPVDCISMLPLQQEVLTRNKKRAAANAAREHYHFHIERSERDKREKAERLEQKEKAVAKPNAESEENAQALIRAALERAKAQAAAVTPQNTGQLAPAQQAQIAEIEARRANAQKLASPK